MFCAAKTTAFMPDAQTLLIVTASTVGESPANMEACRAGAWPTDACKTLPMYTSVIFSTGTPDLAMAALIATAPSCGAGIETKEPLNYKIPTSVSTFTEEISYAPLPLEYGRH